MRTRFGVIMLLVLGLVGGAVALRPGAETGPAAQQGHAATNAEAAATAAALASLPRDLDLIIVVSDARKLRSMRLGAQAESALVEAGVLARLGEGWEELAEKLGWSSEELFDKLLGRQVMFVSRVEAGATKWAAIARVSQETDGRLRERLRVSPRTVVGGRQILALEKGRYELTTRPSPGVDGFVDVVIGPVGASEVFDQLATMHVSGRKGARTATLAGTELLKRVESVCPAHALVLVRERGGGKTPSGEWDRYSLLRARAKDERGREWSVRMEQRDPGLASGLAGAPTMTRERFDRLSAGSVLAAYQGARVERFALPLMSARAVLTGLGVLDESVIATTGGEIIRAVAPEPDGAGGAPARLGITLGVGVGDVRGVREEIDSRMGSLLAQTEARFARGSEGPGVPSGFGGIAPGAVRVVELEFGGAAPRPDELLLGAPMSMSWGCRESKSAAKGWWVATIAPAEGSGSAGAMSRLALEALLGEGAGAEEHEGGYLWLVESRPRELEGALPALLPDVRGFRSVLRRLDHLSARARVVDQGVRGEIELTLAAETPADERAKAR